MTNHVFETAEGKGPPPHKDQPKVETNLGLAIDVRQFMEKSASMYDRQRRIVLDLESKHAIEHAKLVDDYSRRIADLTHEGREKLRASDAEHNRVIGEARQVLAALDRLRNG